MAQITIQDVSQSTLPADVTGQLRGMGRRLLAAKIRQDLGLVPSSEDAAARQKAEAKLGEQILAQFLARPAIPPAPRRGNGKAETAPVEPAATA